MPLKSVYFDFGLFACAVLGIMFFWPLSRQDKATMRYEDRLDTRIAELIDENYDPTEAEEVAKREFRKEREEINAVIQSM